MARIFGSIRKIIKNADLYGYPIGLQYKRKSSYQTVFGGAVTILSRLGILIFLLVLANNIINRQRKVTSKQKYSNLYNKNYFTLNQTNFDIAVGVQFYDGQSHLDIKNELHTYMKFIIDYQEMKYMADNNGSYYVKREIVPYELVPCTNDRFLGLDSQMSSLGINKPGWYCPKDFVMFLQGKIESSDKRMMRVRVFPCQNSTTPLSNNGSQKSQTICKPYEEIYRVMSQTTINVAFINSYFDEDEFVKSPVKHEVKQFFYNFDFNQSYAKLMYIQKSNVITKDSWISSLFGYQNYEFYSVGHIDNTIGIIKPSLFEMFQIIIYQGNYEVFVERQVITLVDILATCGGFANIIILVSRYTCKVFAQPLYYQSLFKKIFKIQKDSNIKRLNTNYDNLRFYNQAKQKFENQVDIVKLIKSVRDLKSLQRVYLQKYQKDILRASQKESILVRDCDPEQKISLVSTLFSSFQFRSKKDKSRQYEQIKKSLIEMQLDETDQINQKILNQLSQNLNLPQNTQDLNFIEQNSQNLTKINEYREIQVLDKSPIRNSYQEEKVSDSSKVISTEEKSNNKQLQPNKDLKDYDLSFNIKNREIGKKESNIKIPKEQMFAIKIQKMDEATDKKDLSNLKVNEKAIEKTQKILKTRKSIKKNRSTFGMIENFNIKDFINAAVEKQSPYNSTKKDKIQAKTKLSQVKFNLYKQGNTLDFFQRDQRKNQLHNLNQDFGSYVHEQRLFTKVKHQIPKQLKSELIKPYEFYEINIDQ
eukprot:403350137